jgi:hypothetical protein
MTQFRTIEPVQVSAPEIVLTATDARSAVKPGRMQYVLGVSLALAIMAMAGIFFVFV